MKQLNTSLLKTDLKGLHDCTTWEEKGIYNKFCKGLKIDHADECFMHKPDPQVENEVHQIL